MPHFDTRLLIDNQWVDAADGNTLAVLNPATGTAVGRVACATEADLQRAVAAAAAGFTHWRDVPAVERSAFMRRAAALLRERQASLAERITVEQGKPLPEARTEAAAAADILEWFADEGTRIYGRTVPSRSPRTQLQFVVKEPVGPVAAFTPWNFPLTQVVRKLGAALTAGCSFLLKAPEETPAAPAALMQALLDAGLPAGVVGLVFGDPAEISRYLITHPAIRKISFTGSTAVGKQLAALAGSHMKLVTMELGGHAPAIVCEDADLELAVQCLAAAKFRNAGQVCIAPSCLLVHEAIRPAFVRALADHAGSIKVGDGLHPGTRMGPLANDRRIAAMERLVGNAEASGASVLVGGQRLPGDGYFYAPTVIDAVPAHAMLFGEEPFGPIAAVQGFTRLDDAIAEANRLPYGLAGYAFTRSLATIHALTRELEVGMLWVNQAATPSPELPFGGIKDSGVGSEGGPEAVEAYLNTKAVAITMG